MNTLFELNVEIRSEGKKKNHFYSFIQLMALTQIFFFAPSLHSRPRWILWTLIELSVIAFIFIFESSSFEFYLRVARDFVSCSNFSLCLFLGESIPPK